MADSDLLIGVGYMFLRFRHARSLKDKRQVTRSVIQKLRNLGFSAVESDYADDAKKGTIGFAFVGTGVSGVKKRWMKLFVCLWVIFEVLRSSRDILDFDADKEFVDAGLDILPRE